MPDNSGNSKKSVMCTEDAQGAEVWRPNVPFCVSKFQHQFIKRVVLREGWNKKAVPAPWLEKD